jgi:hypothetical protein
LAQHFVALGLSAGAEGAAVSTELVRRRGVSTEIGDGDNVPLFTAVLVRLKSCMPEHVGRRKGVYCTNGIVTANKESAGLSHEMLFLYHIFSTNVIQHSKETFRCRCSLARILSSVLHYLGSMLRLQASAFCTSPIISTAWFEQRLKITVMLQNFPIKQLQIQFEKRPILGNDFIRERKRFRIVLAYFAA